MTKAEEFLELGKRERDSYRATKIFSAVLRLEPDNVEALFLRGESYLRFGEYNCEKFAAKDFEKVIELDPTNATAYFKLGEALCKYTANAEGVKNYSKAIELGMNAYVERGRIFACMENYSAALEDFTQAIELGTNVYVERGKIFVKLENYSAALEDFTRAIELNPNNTAAYYLRGLCWKKLDDEEKSQADFDKYEELKRLDDLREEIDRFSRLIEREPYDCFHYSARAEKYFELQEYGKALADLDEAIKLNPRDLRLHERRKEIFLLTC